METDFRSTDWQKLTFAVIGLGLIGGSYAKALRKIGVKSIIGVEQNAAVLRRARDMGVIDVALSGAGEELRRADIIICAVYPDAIVDFVAGGVQFFKENVLVTDAAGTKNNLPAAVQALLKPGMEFISGHPMAGRQGSGLAMSDADIFINANYIIVPEKHNTQDAVQWLESFALALGCRNTVLVTAKEHDEIIAYASNLPHVTAVALMNSASYSDKTKYFIAGSFRDGTRVADINPELWRGLFLANKDKVVEEIDKYIEQLTLFKQALQNGNGEELEKILSKAAARRKELY